MKYRVSLQCVKSRNAGLVKQLKERSRTVKQLEDEFAAMRHASFDDDTQSKVASDFSKIIESAGLPEIEDTIVKYLLKANV